MSANPHRPAAFRLRDALEAQSAGVPLAKLTASVDRLIGRYRAGGAAQAPILASEVDVLAYALYRMPATFAACQNLLQHSAFQLGGIESVVDLGGGTGAAAWAALEEWPDATVTVLDQVEPALRLGQRLRSDEPGGVEFRRWLAGGAAPPADLVTVSYVLSELTAADQLGVTRAAMSAARRAVAVVEPGTPDGYARIMAVRDELRSAGWRLVAPCPHQLDCPLVAPDWCHFSARVERSAIHRRLKGGELGHEDEKFAYVVALASGSDEGGASAPDEARILRHPVKRKGLVELQLCRPDGTAGRAVVTKRRGGDYRQARDARWGDAWPV
ncbi:small ribosomal subunit Rsm22 family protein [Flexivirga meconopsidis]|uniref:small ribosomal subunit Rsm22 family protein n=1 Tax=Flexivirga meconopsidis TaxID=2977121 RepID=UPI002240261C